MTTSRATIAAALLLACSGGIQLASQTPARQQRPDPDPSYTSAATAILVDVVVRDRRGRPVTDLSAADFELSEDGVGQKVDTFTRVSRGGGIGVDVAWRAPGTTVAVTNAAGAPPTPADEAADDEATVALVFDHLSAESLRLAQRATLAYVPKQGESGARVGVFATDPGLRVLQAYTTDRSVVRKAVAGVTPSGTSAEEQNGERTDELTERRRELERETASAVAAASSLTGAAMSRNASEIGARETELKLLQTELNMRRSFDHLDREHRGYDTSRALLSVVESLAYMPGRKTIVFFSEGLPVSPMLSARLDHVIEAANRANVTTYAIDANGLRAKSGAGTLKKEVDGFVEDRFSQLATGSDRTNQPMTMAFERVEDTLRLDSRTGLARLAQETGGFLVEQSNDLSSAFRRIDEDNQFHYLLTYSPKNAAFDGKFRTIKVKVGRSGTQVFARKGYRAVRAPHLTGGADYERPALALLAGGPLPNAFAVHAAGFSFPDPARPGLTPLLVHVRTDILRFAVDRQRSTYSGQAVIVVRIRDGAGHDVQKHSQQYLLSGDLKDLDAAGKGEILFYRELDLKPGLYTMESIVFDAGAQRGSARIATLSVPAPAAPALGMSSLVLVNRVEDTADAPTPRTSAPPPLYVGRTLLYPNVGQPISRSTTVELPFYFTLYGNLGAAKAVAQLLRNGQSLAEAPVTLVAAPGSRHQHVGRLPIGTLPSGTYELRVRVEDGGRELARAAFFTLVD